MTLHVKDRPALQMVTDAENSGELTNEKTIFLSLLLERAVR
ncbi:MAG: hypothetical protein SCABRO_03645 [Candidatus Scalindua brodae]|uniref:Uncharacterized protein n=1 Tax=Candidatus Scalindua brodae TaxID=237368 RepID=A0A0B0EEU5_9BACT|nr:MAG: hypothetical protein SCABRO_03645 [Candidatus Scalindua brodae]